MSRKFIVAANWKLNKGPGACKEFLREFLPLVNNSTAEIVIFPPAVNFSVCAGALNSTQVVWGGQNCYAENEGAFTGENSAAVMKEMGASYCLIGHSERRQFFAETDEFIAKKVKCVQDVGLIPMLCLGETLGQRESGKTGEVICNQLKEGLCLVDFNKDFVIAYEPVWAIGTGKVATSEQAEQSHQVLRNALNELGGGAIADRVPILYGGSVKPGNAGELGAQDNIDGFLVGGASLKPVSFIGIVQSRND